MKEGVKKMTIKETLLGIASVMITAGTTAMMASNYVYGGIITATGFGILYLRGYFKNGISKK